MKKFNKIISIVLAAIMILSVSVPAFAADSGSDLPIIYIPGRTDTLYNTVTGERVYPVVDDEIEYIMDAAVEIGKALAKALIEEKIVGDKAWDNYCDVTVDKIGYMFSTIQLDENGNSKDDVGVLWDASTVKVSTKKSNYGVNDYPFEYDWRLDPIDIAKELDIYIGRVLEATGKDQVRLYVHCLGGTIFSAYTKDPNNEFKHKDAIEGVVLSVPTNDSSMTVGALYSNRLKFDPDTLDKWLTYYLTSDQNRVIEDDAINTFLVAFVSMFNQLEVLGYGTDTVEYIYSKIKDNLVPRLLRSCFFFPSYFAMIGDEYWDDAMKCIFTDDVADEYSGYINKITYYHNNVQTSVAQDIKALQESGVKVSNIVRYGCNLLPICEGADALGDGRMEVSSLSYGATTANMDTYLSDKYIENAKANGTYKYISPDRKIDASTCIMPDNTWFIRNLYHAGISPVNSMALTLLKSENQPTVWDYEQYPQYLHYENGTFVPAESTDYYLDSLWTGNLFQAIFKLIKSLFSILVGFFSN